MTNETSDRPMEDGDEHDLCHLINKEMRDGLTPNEDKRKAVLIRLFKSGK